MSVYLWVAAYAFRRHAAYPLGAVAEAVTNTAFGFLRAYVVLALWHARPELGGYTAADAVAYCFVTQAMIGPMQLFQTLELTHRIRTGDVAIDMHRPVDLQGWWLADDLGRAASTLLLRSLLPMAAGMLAFDLRLPGPAGWAAFAAAVLLAVLASFAIRYLWALAVFWLDDDRGIASLALVLSMFFSGLVLPLVAFPGPLGGLARALPWAAVIQVPADVFLGRHTGAGLLGAYVFALAWALALLAAGRWLTGRARHRLVINGG